MKKLLKIKGTVALTRKEQQTVNGGFFQSCTQQGPFCCVSIPGELFCEPGKCKFGGCLYY